MSMLTDLTYRCVSYPAFEPDQTWLRQMLLFADEVYRIIPRHNTKDDSDELKRLIELTDGAVKTCDPHDFVDIEPAQAELFGRALDQPSLLRVAELRSRVDGIVEHVGSEMDRFKKSKAGSKFHEWVPFVVTSLLPIAATLAYGPLPGAATGLFSFGINAISKATKKTAQFRHPKVLQTLCAVNATTARAAVRKLSK